nr:sulfur oxidation c-type cytochrome SoxX [Betaproteobacteria bacterium]
MKKIIPFALVGATLVLAGCMSTSISSADADKLTAEITANSFQSKGIAKVERLQQDEANRLCSAANVAGKPLAADVAAAIEAAQLKTIQ